MSETRLLRLLFWAFTFTLSLGAANNSRAASLIFDCSFPTWVSQANPQGQPIVRSGPGAFTLKYFYDPVTKRMTTLDGAATWPVDFYRGMDGISIIQDRNSGGNMSTVIIVVEGEDRGRAVYNRMTLGLGGRFVPSHGYGRCEYTGIVPLPSKD